MVLGIHLRRGICADADERVYIQAGPQVNVLGHTFLKQGFRAYTSAGDYKLTAIFSRTISPIMSAGVLWSAIDLVNR